LQIHHWPILFVQRLKPTPRFHIRDLVPVTDWPAAVLSTSHLSADFASRS
jgi:hypothetical protein